MFRINLIQKWLLWQLVIGNRALGIWAHETLLLSKLTCVYIESAM